MEEFADMYAFQLQWTKKASHLIELTNYSARAMHNASFRCGLLIENFAVKEFVAMPPQEFIKPATEEYASPAFCTKEQQLPPVLCWLQQTKSGDDSATLTCSPKWMTVLNHWVLPASFQLYMPARYTGKSRSMHETSVRPPSQLNVARTNLYRCHLV